MLEFSPTLDARWCYLIVFLCALFSAYWQLYGRLSVLKEKVIYAWSLNSTWVVFTIYLLVPLLLFWLLDRADAIHDTSAFAALLVGFAYPAVLSGTTSIKPIQGLGGVFDWLNKIADSLVTRTTSKVTLRAQLFERTVVDYLENDVNALTQATNLALHYSDSRDQVNRDLTAAGANNRLKAQVVYDAATGSAEGLQPISKLLGTLKPKPKITSPYYQARGKALFYGSLGFVLAVTAIILVFTAGRERFLMWRVVKPGVTILDLRRSRDSLRQMLAEKDERANRIRSRLADTLQKPGLESQRIDQILQLILSSRGNTNDLEFKQTALLLTGALRFADVDVRVRIHHALLLLAEETLGPLASSTDDNLKSLGKWTPIATESLTDLETKWRAWQLWWQK